MKQLSLFDSDLEKKVNDNSKAENIEPQIVNNKELYGLRYCHLRCFLSKAPTNYEGIQRIFQGMNNIDVPHKLMQQMNTSEILALYAGVSEAKQYKYVGEEEISEFYNNLIDNPFENLVSKIVSLGSKYKGINDLKKRGFNNHNTDSGELIKRIQKLPDQTKKKFMDSLDKDYRKPHRHVRAGYFYDPNIDGKEDYTGKKIYMRQIIDRLEDIYNNNIRKKK